MAAQEEFQCPLESGFFAHDTSCDRYWHCQDDVAELKLCANGLAFDDTDPRNQRENCDYIYNVECGDRTEIGTLFYFTTTNLIVITLNNCCWCVQRRPSQRPTASV